MTILHPTKVDAAFWDTFDQNRGWPLSKEWQQELYNYLILGFPPGSFHRAVFENDLYRAAVSSHPSNTWPAIVAMCKWIINVGPNEAFGSREKVNAWLKLSKEERTKILLDKGLLISEEEVAWNILSSSQ